jgi:hypothetical protein
VAVVVKSKYLARARNKKEVLKIKRKISKRTDDDDDEAKYFLLEIEDKISGFDGIEQRPIQ